MENELLILAVLICFAMYSLLSNAFSKTVLTLPIVFVGFGYALSTTPVLTGREASLLSGKAHLLAEITLILVLFSDASKVRFSMFRQIWPYARRMLLLGMPLTILLGTATLYALRPEIGLAMALLVAALLTPTDAALAQIVVTSKEVPPRLSQSINVESGLNDGLALPFVLIGASLAAIDGPVLTKGFFAGVVLQVIIAPIVGVVVGWVMAKLMSRAVKQGYMLISASGVVFVCAPMMAYLLSGLVGGNGFIAAFVAGMAFGNSFRKDAHFISEFMEGIDQILTMSAFLVFGAVLLPEALEVVTPQIIIIAFLFLTVIRMLPIFVSLTGTDLNVQEKLFLGWFGPRGLASILFTLIMIEEFDLEHSDLLLACVGLTVFFSVILHGVSAILVSKHFSKAPPS